MKRCATACMVLVVLGCLAGVAPAYTVNPYASNADDFLGSNSDQPGTGATLTFSGTYWAGNLTSLNNGGASTFAQGDSIGNGYGLYQGMSVTYTFDLTNAPNGWNIDEITSYAAWDEKRAYQEYSVLATFADKTPQYVIGSADAGVSFIGEGNLSTKIDITGLGLTGVTSLTFSNFGTASMGMGTVYHEIDVFGSASPIPEPSSIIILMTGLFGLLAYAWRKRK